MIGTAVVVARSALIAVLQADETLDAQGVRISYGKPVLPIDLTADDGDFEAIWLGDADLSYEIPVLTAGQIHRDETIRQSLLIQVIKPGTESADDVDLQQLADVRAKELVDQVQQILANNVDLGVTDPQRFEAVMVEARLVGGYLGNTQSRGCRFESIVEFTARLTPT